MVADPSETIHLINTGTGLQALIDAIRGARRLALDTEFHAERRFLPELMLVQIATKPGEVWLLDPQAIDPAPALQAITTQELIVHGGSQDLRLIGALGAAPQRILDTQQSAGLLGLRYPERLQRLTAHFLDTPMDKGATLSDWSARPLSSRQLRYAAEDALLLLPLAERIEAGLEERGRLTWAWSLGDELRAEALQGEAIPNLLESWEICSRLGDDALKVIDALQSWRYAQAERRDQPAYYLLPDSMLLDLARRRPTSMRALSENRRLHPGLIKRHGRAILECISDAVRAPLARFPPTQSERQQSRALMLWAELTGALLGIAPDLLIPDPLKVLRDGPDALTGWRRIFQPRLKKFLTGQEVIRFDPDHNCMRLMQIN
jgi:ribonuclease D